MLEVPWLKSDRADLSISTQNSPKWSKMDFLNIISKTWRKTDLTGKNLFCAKLGLKLIFILFLLLWIHFIVCGGGGGGAAVDSFYLVVGVCWWRFIYLLFISFFCIFFLYFLLLQFLD